MNSTNEIIFLVIGIIAGVISDGTICCLLFGRKPANPTDEKAKQQYEKDITRLETSLAYANREVEEKKRFGVRIGIASLARLPANSTKIQRI